MPDRPVPRPPSDDVVIAVRNVGKVYRLYDRPQDRLKHSLLWRFGRSYGRDFWALQDVSFEVRRGETFGIIGRNGAGKSTLLQILAGILEPTVGEVHVRGRVAALLELGSGFNPEFTGRENVFLNGAILGIPRSEMERHLDDIVAFADIGPFIDQPVKLYSSGMLMRLAFAVATHVEADVLLIDEVLAVGDVFFRQKCYRWLETLRERGVTIVLVSHAMTEVEQFCERALLLDGGRAVFLGSASEVVKRYYLLEQQGRAFAPPPETAPTAADLQILSEFAPTEADFWPPPEAFFDLSKATQVSNGWARCTGVALCDSQGRPTRVFAQGETACFYYEFEVLRDIEVPVGGIVIQNDKGIHVHGKNTLQYGTSVPLQVPKGARLRFRQDIALNLQIGEYTFEVGLAMIRPEDYRRLRAWNHAELYARTLRLCRLPGLGPLVVTWRTQWDTTQLTHHGVADLPGRCALQVIGPEKQHTKETFGHLRPSQPPTIFHVTHWKAGSQWIHRILRSCVPDLIVDPQIDNVQFLREPIRPGKVYPTVYVTREEFESVRLPDHWRRFVIVRDLRDTLVSAYFSIRYSHPVIDARIARWRAALASMDVEDGLIYLIDEWLPLCARIQASWVESGERLIHYEDLLEHDVEILESVLIDECQLPVSRECLRQAIVANRFEHMTGGRPRGQEDLRAHERKGIVGDWRNYFTDRVKRVFKDRYGRLLIMTGYEKDQDW
jgi:ABC-type polysaccharide/polyol phosphate transport system ATPase subunit